MTVHKINDDDTGELAEATTTALRIGRKVAMDALVIMLDSDTEVARGSGTDTDLLSPVNLLVNLSIPAAVNTLMAAGHLALLEMQDSGRASAEDVAMLKEAYVDAIATAIEAAADGESMMEMGAAVAIKRRD